MSFLFAKRTKNAMKWVWIVFSVVIILSMVLVFSGGHQGAFTGNARGQNAAQQTPEFEIQNAGEITLNPSEESDEFVSEDMMGEHSSNDTAMQEPDSVELEGSSSAESDTPAGSSDSDTEFEFNISG